MPNPILSCSSWALAGLAFGSVVPAQWTSRGPSPASDCVAAAYDEARAVTVAVFRTGPLDVQTWEWNGTAWTHNAAAGSPGIVQDDGIALMYDPVGHRVLAVVAEGPGSNGGWLFAYGGQAWVGMAPAQPRPPGSNAIAAAFDTQRGVVVAYVNGQTWEWNGVGWTLAVASSLPGDLRRARMVYDPLQQHCLLIGGRPGSEPWLNAITWQWNGAAWTAGPASSLTQRVQHGATFDGVGGRPMRYGGSTEGMPLYQWFADSAVLDAGVWGDQVGVPTGAPMAMLGSHLAADLARGRVVLVGAETWELVRPTPASFARFGAGCAGLGGVPQLDLAAGRMAWLGHDLGLRVSTLGAAGFAAVAFGLSNTTYGGAALPAPLPGTVGCDLLVGLDVMQVALTSGGTAEFTLPVPVGTFAAGFEFFAQAAVPDPGNPLGLVVSHGVRIVVGTR
ncbi:MAG: hypothetical protein KF830_03905 [Planctomycetes bacterium]|nr:hypothetical protein [Planctomycetota bacterium]